MTNPPVRRACVSFIVAGAATVALAACAAHPPSYAKLSTRAAGQAAGASAPSSISLPAQALESYLRKAQGIDAPTSGPAAVNSALNVGASHDPKQLEAGVVALAAMTALQEPTFVAGVKAAARNPAARKALVVRLSRDPGSAVALTGGKRAAGRASAALSDLAAPLAASGREVKKASYTVQRQSWAKADVADPKGRLLRVKQISAAGYNPASGDGSQLRRAVSSDRQGPTASVAVSRGVAAAALTVLGESTQAKALLSEPNAGFCLRIAKLNYFQCLASAGPYYEDIYCLGEHAMIEPAQCISAAAKPKAGRSAGRAEKISFQR